MKKTLTQLSNTDLGNNVYKLFEKVSTVKNGIFVDLGVRSGTSSQTMLINSETYNNRVFGVDVDFSVLSSDVQQHPKYTMLLADSATAGKYWKEPIHGLFIDTFHIKEQVMSELYYWYPHLLEGGFIAFHDSNWPKDKYDEYGGIRWSRVEEGIKEFFNISNLIYEDAFIKSEHYLESWGMTIITVKKKSSYIERYEKWNEVFNKRNYLIGLFWNEYNKGDVKIDLTL